MAIQHLSGAAFASQIHRWIRIGTALTLMLTTLFAATVSSGVELTEISRFWLDRTSN